MLHAGQIETLLNRFKNAGLLDASPEPKPGADAALQNAVTLPPHAAGPSPSEERVPEPLHTAAAPVPADGLPLLGDVTSTWSQLVTREGRAWFNDRAAACGIDLSERINYQF